MDIYSLFSGIGGLDVAVSSVCRDLGETCRTLAYVEREAFAVGVLATKMQHGALDEGPVWSDIETFKPGLADAVIAGVPCQGFSVAGPQLGLFDGRSGLWFSVVRVLEESGAQLLFFENVPGIRTTGFGQVLEDLAKLGFNAEWGCIEAAAIGAPHRRDRVFLLGWRSAAQPLVDRLSERATALRDWRGWLSAGSIMGDSSRKRLEKLGPGREGQLKASRRRSVDLGSPVWPPGRLDLEGWTSFVKQIRGPEPCIRRNAHGLSSRVDAIRALGGSVVPQQAYAAFVELFRRAKS